MPAIRIPAPIVPGDTIGVTAPSTGVAPDLRARFDFCAAQVQARGFKVKLGACLFGSGATSAPAPQRAAELMSMMLDERIHAVMPPWGGELLIEILPLLDFEALARARPKWFVSWSDGTTFMLPYLLHTGTVSLHGMNFMDAAFSPAPGAAWWRDVMALQAGASFRQTALTHHQNGWTRYQDQPEVSTYRAATPTQWRVLGAQRDVRVSGRLIGGCADVLSRLMGTPYGDIERFAHAQRDEGVIVYLENCEMASFEAARCWQQFKLAGWFKHARAVLIGRTVGEARGDYTQHAALADALGDLPIPVIYDMDIGHQPPQHLVLNGALSEVSYVDGRGEWRQVMA